MTEPAPTHLDQRGPALPASADIREEVDNAIEAYHDLANLVLLAPEDRWDEFLRLTGTEAANDEANYRGVRIRKGPVTAVVAQEGF